MGRRPDGRIARTVTVTFRTSLEGAKMIDRLRGKQSRSAYLRGLLAREAQQQPK